MRHDMSLRDDASMMQGRAVHVDAMPEARGRPRKRPETDADAQFVFSLFESVRGAEMSMFDEAIRSHLVRMQFNAMTTGYRTGFPNADYYVIEIGDCPSGRLILDVTTTLVRVVYIAFLPQFRSRGFGEAIMRDALDVARCSGAVCEANVAQGNSASLRLWKKLGFEKCSETATDILMQRGSA